MMRHKKTTGRKKRKRATPVAASRRGATFRRGGRLAEAAVRHMLGANFRFRHVDPEHERLWQGAFEAQETGICNIHHLRMQKKRVPVAFGLSVFDLDGQYSSAELTYFPNAQEYVEGGCCVEPEVQKEAHYRYVCPECKHAQRQWAIAHPESICSKAILEVDEAFQDHAMPKKPAGQKKRRQRNPRRS